MGMRPQTRAGLAPRAWCANRRESCVCARPPQRRSSVGVIWSAMVGESLHHRRPRRGRRCLRAQLWL